MRVSFRNVARAGKGGRGERVERSMEAEAAEFEALIVPHRSLTPRGLALLLGAITAGCLLSTAGFVAIGAWPVAGFAGVEIVLAGLLLRLNARAARAVEVLTLEPAGLRVVRVSRRGGRAERVLPVGWLSVDLRDRPGRVPALLLRGPGVQEEVGASLGEAEKRDLAAALREALRARREPVFRNPQLES